MLYLAIFPNSSKRELKRIIVKIRKKKPLNEFEKKIHVWLITNGYTITLYSWIRFSELPKWILKDYSEGKISKRKGRDIYNKSVKISREKQNQQVDTMIIKYINNLREWIGDNEI